MARLAGVVQAGKRAKPRRLTRSAQTRYFQDFLLQHRTGSAQRDTKRFVNRAIGGTAMLTDRARAGVSAIIGITMILLAVRLLIGVKAFPL